MFLDVSDSYSREFFPDYCPPFLYDICLSEQQQSQGSLLEGKRAVKCLFSPDLYDLIRSGSLQEGDLLKVGYPLYTHCFTHTYIFIRFKA